MFVADAKKIFNIRGQWTEEKLEETMADVMVNGESAKRSAVSLLMVGPIYSTTRLTKTHEESDYKAQLCASSSPIGKAP